MADPTVKDVQTLVAKLPAPPIDEVLKKFQGVHTPKTLAAVRRIRAKGRTVKIPRNLLRQLWRVTGGWKLTELKAGWEGQKPDNNWKVFQMGDLKLIVLYTSWNSIGLLEYRGIKVANITQWLDKTLLIGATDALGVSYKG